MLVDWVLVLETTTRVQNKYGLPALVPRACPNSSTTIDVQDNSQVDGEDDEVTDQCNEGNNKEYTTTRN